MTRTTPERTGVRPPAAGAHPAPERPIPTVHSPVAVIVSRFPKITETFILREIQELERQGRPVRLVPLLRQQDPVVHPEAEPWVERALYTPFLSLPIAMENVRAFLESPGRYLGVLARTLSGSLPSPNLLRGTLGIFPKSVYLGRILEREGVGHLHAHFATHPATAAWIASAFSGIPWSFTAHAHDIFLPGSRPLLAEKLRRACVVRVISDYNRRFLEERYPDAADGRIRVVHMGIESERYGPADPESHRILCVASLQPYKGIPSLVEACARRPLRGRKFELVIVGDGPQRRELERRIRRLGLEHRVRLLGPRTQDEVRELLSRASIFVHPSTVTRRGWMDGIPVALMEAMATEVPVVSTWVSGIPELVDDGESGILVFPDDPTALAEALTTLLADPHRARALGARGRRKVLESFHLDTCTSELIAVLDPHTLPVSPEVVEALRPGLPVAAAHGNGTGNPAVGIHRVHHRRDSIVAEVLPPGPKGDAGLVVKVHRAVEGAPRSAGERARIEFGILNDLHIPVPAHATRSPDPGDGAARARFTGTVPRPLALLEADGGLVMERAPGRSLDVLIRDWRGGGPAMDPVVLPALRATGRWLRWFQEKARREDPRCPESAFETLLRQARRDLERYRGWLPSGLESAVRARLRRLEKGGASAPEATVAHHCDFWPGNVLVSRTGITVLDFEGARQGLAWEDVAHFLAHLDLALSRPWRRTARARARRAFLEGYAPGGIPDPDRLDLCLTAKGLELLARTTDGHGGAGVRWWKRRTLRGFLARAADGSADATGRGKGPP